MGAEEDSDHDQLTSSDQLFNLAAVGCEDNSLCVYIIDKYGENEYEEFQLFAKIPLPDHTSGNISVNYETKVAYVPINSMGVAVVDLSLNESKEAKLHLINNDDKDLDDRVVKILETGGATKTEFHVDNRGKEVVYVANYNKNINLVQVGKQNNKFDLIFNGLSADQEENPGGFVAVGSDLVPLQIDCYPETGILSFTITQQGDQVKVWADRHKTAQINSMKTWKLESDIIPTTVYVEGINVSLSQQDIEMSLGYTNDDNMAFNDKVLVTSISFEIEKCDKNFIPKGGQEDNSTAIKAFVRPIAVKGGFRFILFDVSDEPGYCMNAPQNSVLVGEDSDSWKDLQFPVQLNYDFNIFDSVAESKNDSLNEATIWIRSFDYGAYGKLKSEINIYGQTFVAKEKDGIKKFTNIPWDDNNNKIADNTTQDNNGYPATIDDDENPIAYKKYDDPNGGLSKGDGLSTYEEYRGFMLSGVHKRTEINSKDVFIHDVNGIGLGYFNSSGLTIHLISHSDYSQCVAGSTSGREINFNRNNSLSATPYSGQHIIRVEDGIINSTNIPGLPVGKSAYGMGVFHKDNDYCTEDPNFRPIDNIWTPGDFSRIVIDKSKIWNHWSPGGTFYNVNPSNTPQAVLNYFIAHELGHAVNIKHHGEFDWGGTSLQGGRNSGVENCVMRDFRGDEYKLLGVVYGYGNDALSAKIYGEENVGNNYCTQRQGTGVNLQSRLPRAKTGDATMGFCKYQIKVKDN